jgi:hypothetical protein
MPLLLLLNVEEGIGKQEHGSSLRVVHEKERERLRVADQILKSGKMLWKLSLWSWYKYYICHLPYV